MQRLLFLVLLGVCATSCGSQPAPRSTPAAPPATVKNYHEHWFRVAFRHVHKCAHGDVQGVDGEIERDVSNATIEACSQMDCSQRLSIGLDGPVWQKCLDDFHAIPCELKMTAPASCKLDRFR